MAGLSRPSSRGTTLTSEVSAHAHDSSARVAQVRALILDANLGSQIAACASKPRIELIVLVVASEACPLLVTRMDVLIRESCSNNFASFVRLV